MQPAQGPGVDGREVPPSEGGEYPVCRETLALLNEFVDGAELDEKTRKQVSEHTRVCPPCHRALDKFHLALSPWHT